MFESAIIACIASNACNVSITRFGNTMTTLTIRNIEPLVKDRLRVCAALNHRSMEEEVRSILRQLMLKPAPSLGLGSRLQARFASLGGVELDLPIRSASPRGAMFGDTAN
jgi:antitoxin FitA